MTVPRRWRYPTDFLVYAKMSGSHFETEALYMHHPRTIHGLNDVATKDARREEAIDIAKNTPVKPGRTYTETVVDAVLGVADKYAAVTEQAPMAQADGDPTVGGV